MTKGEFGDFGEDVAQEAAIGGAVGGGLHTVGAAIKQGYGMGKEVLGRLKPKQSGEAFNLAKTEGVNPAAKEAFAKNTEDISGTAQRFKEAGNEIRGKEGARLGEALTPESGGTFQKVTPPAKASNASDVEAIMADNKIPEEMKQKLISQLEQRGEGAVAEVTQDASNPFIKVYKELDEGEKLLAKELEKGGTSEYVSSINQALEDIKGVKGTLETGGGSAEGSLSDLQNVKRQLDSAIKGKMQSGNPKDVEVRKRLKKINDMISKTIEFHSPEAASASGNYGQLKRWLEPSKKSGTQFPTSGQFKQEAKTAMVGKDMPAQAQQNIGKFREGMENLKTSLPEEQAS